MHHLASGKVREIYDLDDEHLLIITSDRISAFDVVFDEPINDRGRILTALTDYWVGKIATDVPHHLVTTDLPEAAADIPDAIGRTMVVRKAQILPVEFIVRSRLAGSGWKEYQANGTLHGAVLPEGLALGSRLPRPVLTPSTKADAGEHDVNLSLDEAADLIGWGVLNEAEDLALTLYERGAAWAEQKDLILADTKFEFGYIEGHMSVCDEILTPDSSRYWPSRGWELGETPPAFDKQILRDWLETLDWDKSPPPPSLPHEIVDATRGRYIDVYERLTGKAFSDLAGVAG